MARRLPSLNAIRAFEAAARHTSFKAAADELCVTHAAVSRHIRDLETWLDTTLFVRTPRGARPTSIGARYSTRVTPLFEALLAATTEAMGSEGRRLVVTVEPAMASRWLVPRLSRFTSLHPDIELVVTPDAKLVDFRAGEVDLGLRYGSGAWGDVDAECLAESSSFPVCSPKLIADAPPLKPCDLVRYSLLHEQRPRGWEEWLVRAGLAWREEWRGATFQAHLAIEAAEAGLGFALGDAILCTDALIDGRLVRPFEIDVEDPGRYFIVWSRGIRLSSRARAFRAWVESEAAATRQAFAGIRNTLPPPSSHRV